MLLNYAEYKVHPKLSQVAIP